MSSKFIVKRSNAETPNSSPLSLKTAELIIKNHAFVRGLRVFLYKAGTSRERVGKTSKYHPKTVDYFGE